MMNDASPAASDAPPVAPGAEAEPQSVAHGRKALCPRCGYDQRGEMAKWKRSCPLESTCTECGLLIDWRELFNPDFKTPTWCVESAEKWRQIPWRSVKTLFMMPRPWRFWRDLRMSHEIRWSRLATFWAVLLVVVHFAIGGGQAYLFYVEQSASIAWGRVYPGSLVRDCLVQAAAPFAPMPIADGWYGTCLAYGAALWGGGIPAIMAFVTANMTMAFGFILLPISRRRAKVRLRHVFRILAYGVPFLLPVYAFFILGAAAAPYRGLPVGWALGLRLPALIAAAILMVIWWSLATSRYLRMPHAWWIGGVLGVLATVAWTLAMASTGDRSFQDLMLALP